VTDSDQVNGHPETDQPPAPEVIAQALRLRPERPRVTRLSRKMLASATALALVLVSGAVLWALQNDQKRGPAPEELYTTDHHNVADGLGGLPKDYAGISAQCAPTRTAFAGRSRASDCVGTESIRSARS
jgi:type IV secretion system protein VirB10